MPALPAGPEPGADAIVTPEEATGVILTAAIVGAEITRAQTPHLPITAREIADEAARCREAGAAVIHLHVRNDDGTPTQSRERFGEAIARIREKTDCVVQTSTGGAVGMSIDERAQPLMCKPEMATLNCGTINFGDDVFVNTRPQIRDLARPAPRGWTSIPELECYDVGHVEEALALVREGAIGAPLHFQFVLGISGGIGPTAANVRFLRSLLPAGASWAVARGDPGRHQQPMTELAMSLGGHARTSGSRTTSTSSKRRPLGRGSAPLVRRAPRRTPESIGRDAARAGSPPRKLLGLSTRLLTSLRPEVR